MTTRLRYANDLLTDGPYGPPAKWADGVEWDDGASWPYAETWLGDKKLPGQYPVKWADGIEWDADAAWPPDVVWESGQLFPPSAYHPDGSGVSLPQVGEVLSVVAVCGICGLRLRRGCGAIKQRGGRVCQYCVDEPGPGQWRQ